MQSLWYHLICWCLTFMRNCWKSDSLSPSLLVVYMKQQMAIVTAKPVLLLLLLFLYNSLCRVLAFSTNSFYLLLSRIRVFQFGTFDFCISFLTSSSQRVFGLPIGLLEVGFQEYIALTILVSCILSMWPNHPNLYVLMKFTAKPVVT